MKTPCRQSGSTTIEFALVFVMFISFVLFLVDVSRLVYAYNAGSETALLGARYATACADKTDAAKSLVLARMRGLMPEVSDIQLDWIDEDGAAVCDATTCDGVTVRITGMSFRWVTPLLGAFVMPDQVLPDFATYLPRESMRQDANSAAFCSSIV